MAFVVETGAGIEDANAYVDVAFADTYHADRNHTNWTGTTALKQAAIIRASEHVDKRFGPRFRGMRQSHRQGLEWPRLAALDNDDFNLDGIDLVPRQLKKAVAEYALRALRLGELNPDPSRPTAKQDNADPNQAEGASKGSGAITSLSEKVGPIETSTDYEGSGTGAGGAAVSEAFLPAYPAADLWIEELLASTVGRRIARG